MDTGFQRRRRLLPGLCQGLPRRSDGLLRLPQLLLQKDQCVIRCLNGIQLRPALVQIFQHLLYRGPILLFQPVELVRPALRRVQLLRGEIEGPPQVPDGLRQVIGLAPQGSQAFVRLS